VRIDFGVWEEREWAVGSGEWGKAEAVLTNRGSSGRRWGTR